MTTPRPPKRFTTVAGHRLAHVEMGRGDPIVLLHGNPTSSVGRLAGEGAGHLPGLRSPKGEDLVLERNLFIEGVLPSSILRTLSDEETAAYRAPFVRKEDRQPMLNWPRQIPIAGEPPNVVALVQQYAQWLSTGSVPKLFVNAEPGSILVGAQREFCRSWPNQQEVTVPGLHFIQEDSGALIGQSVATWLSRLD